MKKTIRLTESDLHKIISESIKNILNETYENNTDPNMKVRICGGNLQGEYSLGELEDIADIRGYVEPSRNPIYSNKLAGYPRIVGYLGPMWDGDAIRYETQEVYDGLSI